MKKTLFLTAVFFTAGLHAWDVEHDEVAQLTGEFLPREIKACFRFDDFATLLSNCHFPDMTEWGVDGGARRYRTLEDVESITAREDVELLRGQGFTNSGWFHRERGKATCLALMAKSFGNGNYGNAAFYLSVLTHSISDESALNHPPMMQFVQYSRFDGVDYAIRKVEEGAKNVFGFRSDGYVVYRVRQLLEGYVPKAPAGDFASARDILVSKCVDEGNYAACAEGVIAFAPREKTEEALAQLVAMQVRTILDYAWTAWTFRNSWSLPDADFDARIKKNLHKANDALDPSGQSVFAGVFDTAANPTKPKAVAGVVCEPYGMFTITKLSYVGRMLTAAVTRTLRDEGYAVRAFALKDIGKGFPPPGEMQMLFIDLGGCNLDAKQAAALKAYREAGGCLIAAGGNDGKDITGFDPFLVRRENHEVPVSRKWGVTNAEACRKMSILFAGKRFPLRRNPNINGFCKPYAMNSVAEDASIEPIVRLENGKDTFTVAARRGKTVWVSEYLLMPFVWSEDTSADWAEMRLDSFARVLFMDIVERLYFR